MTLGQVEAIIGPGKPAGSAGRVAMYQWERSPTQFATVTFQDGKLVAKSQIGLE